MFLTATDTKCQSRCGTAQGDQRERCNRIKSKQLTPKEKIVTFIQKLNWRKGDRVDDEQHKNYPILQNCFSVALLNLHSRSKANPYVYKKYSKEENNEKQVNRTRNDFNLTKILVI